MTNSVNVREFASGLVLLAEPLSGVESAAFSLRVPCGTSQEPATSGGLAALTSELVLRGAGPRDSRQLVTDLDNLGVERGESVSFSHTSFSGATLARNLLDALTIYADVVRRPNLPEDQFEASRQVVLQELQAVEDEPAQKVMLELQRTHYPDPWGRPSQGDRKALEAATLADVRACVDRCYVPRGAILAVAGRFDWEAVQQRVATLFGDWSGEAPAVGDEHSRGPRLRHLEYASQQTQIGLAYPSVPYSHPDYFQAAGAVGVLGSGMSSRLFTEVRERRGLCYSVYATQHTLRDRGSVLCYAGTTAQRAQETLDVTLGELHRLADGVAADELARLKARIKSALILQQESTSARASAISRDWHLLGRVRPLEEVGRLVDELTCQSINAYLREHPPRDFTLVTVGPEPLEAQLGVP